MKKNILLCAFLLSIFTFIGCNNNDKWPEIKIKPITEKDLCGCSWYRSPGYYISFFEDGTFEEYYDTGRSTNKIVWRFLYKGIWHLEGENSAYWINATYTKAYENAYETEVKGYCKWSKDYIIMSDSRTTLYLGGKRYDRIDYVSPNMTQY